MHKKSIEASEKLSCVEDITCSGIKGEHSELSSRQKDELRSESIATLRAKAQQHSAKVLQSYGPEKGSTTDVKNQQQHSFHRSEHAQDMMTSSQEVRMTSSQEVMSRNVPHSGTNSSLDVLGFNN